MAFVKAIDFWDAMSATDPMTEVGKLVGIAQFEKEILEYCTARRMSRVLRYLGHEYVWVGDRANPLNQVSCLILEAGEADLRRLVHANGLANCAWNLQVLRDVALAIVQLHRDEIAHQDIKPSNVISFTRSPDASTSDMKVGDLGRVVRKGHVGPFDTLPWPGDTRYSPPERWYGYVPPDWCDAREASDAYMLGSLLFYLFTGNSLQAVVTSATPMHFRPGAWSGRYDEDLLPVLMTAHAHALEGQLFPALLPEVADAVMGVARALTHPDPKLRGDTRARQQLGRPVGLDRIHQRITLAALRCAAIERGRQP